jgi:hypothetical protein
MLACDIKHGMLIVECIDPKLTAIAHSSVVSTMRFDTSAFPVVKLITDPPPLACFAWVESPLLNPIPG